MLPVPMFSETSKPSAYEHPAWVPTRHPKSSYGGRPRGEEKGGTLTQDVRKWCPSSACPKVAWVLRARDEANKCGRQGTTGLRFLVPLPRGGLPETEMSLMLTAKNVFGTLPWREAAR